MEWNDIEIDDRHTVKFKSLPYAPTNSPPQSADFAQLCIDKTLGGILHHGEWAWLCKNSMLQIVSLRNGQVISSYDFCDARGYESCYIKCVEEIFSINPTVMLLAIILESFRGPSGGSSYIVIYSVEQSAVFNSIELDLHITCARFMNSSSCRRSLLQNFDGCLAVGSEEGVIVLLDLDIRNLISMHNEWQRDNFVPCHIVDYSLPLTEIHRKFRQCQQERIHFGLQMEVVESPCPIKSILPLDLILGVAIGLEDGRLVLYDLAELQIFYISLPTPEVTMSAIVKMDFLEPPDDPQPCLYIWTLHENGENLHAVLHSLKYEKRLLENDASTTYFETFQTSSVELQLPLEATQSVALTCQAVSNLNAYNEDDGNCLCVIAWLSVLEGKNKLLIFDLNQWYKEEMPYVLEYGKQPNYLAGYILNGECTGLHTHIIPDTIAHYSSIQRFEEHFYPNSLSFECLLLHVEGCRHYNWEGAQNRVINLLRSSNAAIFLEPDLYFKEIIRTRLMPQFIDLHVNSTFSRTAKYEILLSAALEHNCVGLLRDCAKSWIDGSFMGNFSSATGLSLSTITDWLWKRATCIKIRCNDLCKSLFEFSGYPLDNREQTELGFITRQLKLLADLMKEILMYAKRQIPERVFVDLEYKYNSLVIASNYQDILYWLLNIGFLPITSHHNDKINASHDFMRYPYKELKEFYRNKRSFYGEISETFLSKKSGSCRLLFIDSFIEHVCKGNVLREYWLENEGDGLYPPNSLEAMLRVVLVPDLDYDSKCAILLYFFLDLNMAIDEEMYKDVVANFIKFPSVFKLPAPLIKMVQAFWNLDHDHYLLAVDEFISPFNKNQSYPQWQVELLIEVLLNQKACSLALRVLESQPSLISPLLKLNTLLANELLSEAFHFVRSKNDDALLETFFTSCLHNGQYGIIRDLALSEREGLVLQNILKKSNNIPGAESLHFIYLLQKSKYIEAVAYMEELSNKAKSIQTSSLHQPLAVDGPNLVLSAFNTTMTPVTQNLTDIFLRIKNKIKKKEVDNKSPVPLSCQLIKQNANNLLGGIYHSSALSAHFATYYWGEMEEQTKQAKHLLNSNNAPFLRRPQADINCVDNFIKNNISYPQAYKVTEKRTLAASGVLDNERDQIEKQKIEQKLNPKKKRRLIGQEIIDDLTHFMKMNKTANSTNTNDFPLTALEVEQSLVPAGKDSIDFLTKPVRCEKEYESVAIATPEIHGILKTRTPEPEQFRRETLVEEEKSLRFRLPSIDENTTSEHVETNETRNESVVEPMDMQQDEKSEGEAEETGPLQFKQITRAVSEESIKSCISEENFYSPLSSKNNSLLLDGSNVSRSSYASGPKARKPLARLSAERSEKSLTPEQELGKITEATTHSKSSDLHYSTALESSIKSKISSRNPLLRFSLEKLERTATTDMYVTAQETSSKPLDFGSSNLNEEAGGGLASFAISSGSKINEFSPTVSSSKVVVTTPRKAQEENNDSHPAKLSECSTILDPLTTFECNNTDPNNDTLNARKSSNEEQNAEEPKCEFLETTLGMSSYDLSISDSTSPQATTSTDRDATIHTDSRKTDAKQTTVTDECDRGNIEFEEQLGESKKVTSLNEAFTHEICDQKEESSNDCIVLSSSSSSTQSSVEQEEHELSKNTYSDNDEDEEEEYEFDNEQTNEEEYNSEIEAIDDSQTISDGGVVEDYYEEVVQFVEDSSTDLHKQPTNSYSESSSDEVKVIGEVPPSLADSIPLPATEKQAIKDTTSQSKIEEMADINEAKPVENMEDIHTSISTPGNQFEKEALNSIVASNRPSDIDIQINENVGTSTTELITEQESPDVKQQDTSICDSQVDGIEVTTSKAERDTPTETKEKQPNSKRDTELNVIPEAIEEEPVSDANVSKIGDTPKDKSVEIIEIDTISEKFEKVEKLDAKGNENDDVSKTESLKSRKRKGSTLPSTGQVQENVQLTIEKDSVSKEHEKNEGMRVKEMEDDDACVSKARRLRSLRGSSLTPTDFETKVINSVLSPYRKKRGISVPPQTATEPEELPTRRNRRATSLQPKYKSEEDIAMNTPQKVVKSPYTQCAEEKPLVVVEAKASTRRRAVFLDAINEDGDITLDSPSTRTRSRLRLTSIDSDLDSPSIGSSEQLVKLKRNRKTSTSNNSVEVPLTPKRTRFNSFSSQPEKGDAVTVPRSLRGRSVISLYEEDTAMTSDSIKSEKSSKRVGLKREKSTHEEPTTEEQDPKSEQTAVLNEASYSSTRRLTRTQLAIMEKSAVLSQASFKKATAKETDNISSPPANKRTSKSRTARSSNVNADSDDTESVSSSKVSATSSAAGTKRRVTRKSLKEKDDINDDIISVASSVDSGKQLRASRSKDKSSLNTTLSSIPENAPLETAKRGRTAKH